MVSLEGARLKIERAHESRQELNREVLRYLSSRPYEVTFQKETDPIQGRLHLTVRTPPPPGWGPAIGEIIHDTRSALDHLAFALSEQHKGPAPTPLTRRWRNIAFPITTDPDWFKGINVQRRLWAVRPDDQALIETMQPYNKGNWGRLAYISELSNIDKHRKLHLVAAMLQRQEEYISSIRSENCRVTDVQITARNPLQDGAELARFSVLDLEPGARIYVDHDFGFDIAFGDGGPTAGWDLDFIAVLQVMAFDVTAVLNRFAHRFPSSTESA